MQISGRVAADSPDPAEEWQAQAAALGVSVAGFVPQRHLEDWGISGVMSSSEGIGPDAVQSASFPRSYTVWRNPEDRADLVNLAELAPQLQRALDRDLPVDLPAWLLRARERMRYPTLWEAVQTHWFAEGMEEGQGKERSTEELLYAHVDSILRNQFRDELGLSDIEESRTRIDLVPWTAMQECDVTVDGIRRLGVQLDTGPFVLGLGTALDDGRVVTAVVPRDLLDLVTLELASDPS